MQGGRREGFGLSLLPHTREEKHAELRIERRVLASPTVKPGADSASQINTAAMKTATTVQVVLKILRMFRSWIFLLEDPLAAVASRPGGARQSRALAGRPLAVHGA